MMKVSLSSWLFFIVLLVSCQKEVEKPKVIYGDSTKKAATVSVDSAKVEIADLPIQMEGTDYLLHPVGDMRVLERGDKSRFGSSAVKDVSFTISNVSQFEITGYLQNVKFQKVNSDSIRPLTQKPVLIETITYLKTVSDNLGKKILVYTLVDNDTNRDGKLDTNDINTLYLSWFSGQNFVKMSAELEELIDWNLIESNNKLYFRTIEDTNKNGQFDKNDVLHYNYIDLSKNKWEVIRYSPV